MADTSSAKQAASSAANSKDNSVAWKSVKDTSLSWQMMAYGTMIGDNYDSYRTALINHMATLIAGETGSSEKDAVGSAEAMVTQQEQDQPDYALNGGKVNNPHMFASPSVSDASVGGNDAINPYSAFCRDDDIIHDHYESANGEYDWGMGRCYAEMYESKQQILYLTMGLPKFRNLQTWLKNACNKELSEMNDIGTISLASKLGKLLGSAFKLAIQLPWLPLKWGANIISYAHDYPVTEYFYFRDNMPLYYRYVNTILSEVAVGMGLYGNSDANVSDDSGNKGTPNNGSNMSTTQQAKYAMNLPVIMREGPDIFKIMCRRASRLASNTKSVSDSDSLFTEMEKNYNQANKEDKSDSIWDKFKSGLSHFWTGMTTGALEGMNFIGFRIEKCEIANESFSNSHTPSPLLGTLNNEVAKKRELAMGALTGGEGGLSNALKFAKNMKDIGARLNNLMSKGSLTDKVEASIAFMASGNGYFDLPEQWSGSHGMSRNLSFNMKLRAKTGGDNVSIFQSIMIPLACLLAAALPRGSGDATYTSPFIVRAFCKGMFAIPAGMITTLSITRGSGEFGWSLSKLPTVVDVSFTIEDLSPMLFLSIAGGAGMMEAIGQAFTNNTKMHEYINTLVGIGAKERYYLLGQLKRRLQTALLIGKNTVFSATYRGYVMGDSSIIRSLMALTPWTRVKNN